MSELRCEKLRHVYSAGTPFEKVAVDCIDLTVPQGQLIGLIGHTGSGKSTLIQHLNALLTPTSGRVLYDGRDITESMRRPDSPESTENSMNGHLWSFPEDRSAG